MAHDHQLPLEKTNDTNEASRLSKECSDIVADWLIVYGKVYREEVTPELAIAFSLFSKEKLNPEILHQAFLRAMKLSKFRPTPEEVFEAYAAVADRLPRGNKPKYLDEEPLSKEERAKIVAENPFVLPGETRIDYEGMKETGIGLPHKKV